MVPIEWKRGSPLRYFSTAKPSILGRSRPRKSKSEGPCLEREQRRERIIEAGHLVALTVEDDLEDLARRRRGVQHDDSQLPCHVRCSLLLRCLVPVCVQPPFQVSTSSIACLPHALLMSIHDSLTVLGYEGGHAPLGEQESGASGMRGSLFHSLALREE